MSAGIFELRMTLKVTSYALSKAVPNNQDEKQNSTNRFVEVKNPQLQVGKCPNLQF